MEGDRGQTIISRGCSTPRGPSGLHDTSASRMLVQLPPYEHDRSRPPDPLATPATQMQKYSRLFVEEEHIGTALKERVGSRKTGETTADNDNLGHCCADECGEGGG